MVFRPWFVPSDNDHKEYRRERGKLCFERKICCVHPHRGLSGPRLVLQISQLNWQPGEFVTVPLMQPGTGAKVLPDWSES